MQDIDSASDVADNLERPLASFIYAISCMHCMTVSLAQGGDGLGAAWGEELALSMLKDAGFGKVETHRLEHDIMNLYYVRSEEHTSELQSLMRISYAVFCLKQNKTNI